jgi:hypothetical protein
MIDYIVSQLVGLGVGGFLTYFVPKIYATAKAKIVAWANEPDPQ